MKISFLKAWKIFKYLILLLSLFYWPYVIIDDWGLITKHWPSNMIISLGIWLGYYIVFALILTMYYWGIVTIIIMLYHKIIHPNNARNN